MEPQSRSAPRFADRKVKRSHLISVIRQTGAALQANVQVSPRIIEAAAEQARACGDLPAGSGSDHVRGWQQLLAVIMQALAGHAGH
jgi:hypothetical protein